MIVDALMQFEDDADIQVLALRALCVLCRYSQKGGNPRNDMAVETVMSTTSSTVGLERKFYRTASGPGAA